VQTWFTPAQSTVTYQSRLVRYMSTLTFALPIVFGFMGEQQTLSVPIMNNYYDGSGLVRTSTNMDCNSTLALSNAW